MLIKLLLASQPGGFTLPNVPFWLPVLHLGQIPVFDGVSLHQPLPLSVYLLQLRLLASEFPFVLISGL